MSTWQTVECEKACWKASSLGHCLPAAFFLPLLAQVILAALLLSAPPNASAMSPRTISSLEIRITTVCENLVHWCFEEVGAGPNKGISFRNFSPTKFVWQQKMHVRRGCLSKFADSNHSEYQIRGFSSSQQLCKRASNTYPSIEHKIVPVLAFRTRLSDLIIFLGQTNPS